MYSTYIQNYFCNHSFIFTSFKVNFKIIIIISPETCCCNTIRILSKYYRKSERNIKIMRRTVKNICMSQKYRWSKKDYAILLKH